MVINPSPVALPVNTANIPTESVRNEAREQERVPETRAPTESVNLKRSADDSQQISRQEGRVDDARSDSSTDKTGQERNVQEKEEGGRDSNREQSSRDGGKKDDSSSEQERQEQRQERKEEQQVRELQARDREVKAHEAAHAAVGGQYAGAPSYTYQTGPDGKRYAVGGEVPIDTSVVPNDPQATISKMEQVQRAALAPADPSPQDRSVASQAAAKEAQARSDVLKEQRDLFENDPQNRPQSQRAEDVKVRFESRLRDSGAVDTYQAGQFVAVQA